LAEFNSKFLLFAQFETYCEVPVKLYWNYWHYEVGGLPLALVGHFIVARFVIFKFI